jgi:hypothetical protein
MSAFRTISSAGHSTPVAAPVLAVTEVGEDPSVSSSNGSRRASKMRRQIS